MAGVSKHSYSPTIAPLVRLFYLEYILKMSSLIKPNRSLAPSEIIASSVDYIKETSLIWKL
jgi:hypothetical protein